MLLFEALYMAFLLGPSQHDAAQSLTARLVSQTPSPFSLDPLFHPRNFRENSGFRVRDVVGSAVLVPGLGLRFRVQASRNAFGLGLQGSRFGSSINKPPGSDEVQSLAPLRGTCRQPASTGEQASARC